MSGLAVFILTSIIAYFVRKYFYYRPKVTVNFHSNGNSSSIENVKEMRLAWNYEIVFKNITKYDAISLSVDYGGFPFNCITKQKFSHIKGLAEESLQFHYTCLFDREVVNKSKHQFKDLMPIEIKEATFIVTYCNEMEKRFYTKFVRVGEIEKNTFYRIKPRRKSRI
ncbi:MAG: hypothetical protein KF721_09765 [Ignavibacteriaceae bacterium]|nr:hypothetical protein [Ignavibacteriaceae bacterium]